MSCDPYLNVKSRQEDLFHSAPFCLVPAQTIFSYATKKVAKKQFLVVWTTKGEPLIELIHFDLQHWKEVLAYLVIFFKTYIQRVLLGLRDLCYWLACDKFCLEPDEFEEDSENSLQRELCSQWYRWGCVGISETTCPEQYTCQSCNNIEK